MEVNSDDVVHNTSVKDPTRFPGWIPITSSHHNLLLQNQHSYWKIMILFFY